MGRDYSEVVERPQLYRRAQRKTQKEMSADMGITQSHYAKLESGANIISYDCLKAFEGNGGDINFLITGQYSEPGVLDDYMKQCITREGKLRMHRLIVWAVNMGFALECGKKAELPEAVYRNLRLAQMEFEMPWSVWKSIRKLDEITQYRMAEILGINIKRYIKLEKEMIELGRRDPIPVIYWIILFPVSCNAFIQLLSEGGMMHGSLFRGSTRQAGFADRAGLRADPGW